MPVLPASRENIAKAARAIAEGRLVAFPTETVYGLAADATNGEAIARLYAAKGRPRFNPLIVHVSDTGDADRHGELTPLAVQLATALWPGPLTLVVRRRHGSPISDLATAGLGTVALRVPDHPIAQSVLRASGLPLAAPSANRSGHVSATTAQHVIGDLDTSVIIVIDGGPTAHGIESTILDVTGTGAILLRAGAIPTTIIEAVTGAAIDRRHENPTRPAAPGQLVSHYAPRAALRLNATSLLPGEALLAFGPAALPDGVAAINLSPTGELMEAAVNLFAALRRLDATGAHTIAVMPIPEWELGEAINDRLRRAAAPRQ